MGVRFRVHGLADRWGRASLLADSSGPLFVKPELKPICPPCQCQCECLANSESGLFGLGIELFLLVVISVLLALLGWVLHSRPLLAIPSDSWKGKGGKKGVYGSSTPLAVQ